MGRWRGALPSAGSHGVLLAPVVMYEHCLHCFDDQHIRSSVIYEYTCQVPTYCICYQLSCIVPTYVQVCRAIACQTVPHFVLRNQYSMGARCVPWYCNTGTGVQYHCICLHTRYRTVWFGSIHVPVPGV